MLDPRLGISRGYIDDTMWYPYDLEKLLVSSTYYNDHYIPHFMLCQTNRLVISLLTILCDHSF